MRNVKSFEFSKEPHVDKAEQPREVAMFGDQNNA